MLVASLARTAGTAPAATAMANAPAAPVANLEEIVSVLLTSASVASTARGRDASKAIAKTLPLSVVAVEERQKLPAVSAVLPGSASAATHAKMGLSAPATRAIAAIVAQGSKSQAKEPRWVVAAVDRPRPRAASAVLRESASAVIPAKTGPNALVTHATAATAVRE